MNKRERVANTLAGLPVDRPPVCFWRHYGNIAPEETVRQAATAAAGGDTRYKIIRYRPFGVREPYKTQIVPPTDAYLAELAELARSCGICDVVIT